MSELDEIRGILRDVAINQQQNQIQLEATQRLAELTLSIANSNARSIEAMGGRIDETLSIANSNAKAITALGQTVADNQEEIEETASQNMVTGRENSRLIEVLISESRENIRQHQAFLERFDRLEGNGNGGRSGEG